MPALPLADLRRRYRDELFERFLPFWDRHGIDHEHGGFFHHLDYDGTLLGTDKFHWFQGRGLWVWSFLYNHFGRDPRHLEVAAKAKDFLLGALQSYHGDVYAMYFAAEGLQEYAFAAGDDQALATALGLVRKLFAHIDRPAYGPRPQGLWMVNLRIATQMLRRWNEPDVAAIADRALEAIIDKHYNPEVGLNTELLNFDFTRPAGEENKCQLGHSVETLWMAMDEADRRADPALWRTCAQRIRHHLDVGWDHVYGGLAQWVNVDRPGYRWPEENPVGTSFRFQGAGEYNYMKSLWALNEALIGTLLIYERTGAEWAARYFSLAQEMIDRKFSLKERGYPGYILFGDRQVTFHPHGDRQDNYHPPRQLMLSLLALERMLVGAP